MKNERMKDNFRSTNNRARGNSVRRGKEQTETPKEEKPVRKAPVTFEDIKQQLAAWAENEHIPGKFQAWFTAEAAPDHSDWRILKTYRGKQEIFSIEAPARGMEAPELVTRVFAQTKKDHLHIFKKALRQIWFRAVGDGRYAMLVQVNLKGKFSAHGYKTFIDFVQRNCPEVISCHHIQCMPDQPFDPAGTIPMKVEAKSAFGSDFMPIGETGISMHVLDWTPRIHDAWLRLPKRIEDAIHPNAEDSFFEFYSGSSFVSASLANQFKRVVSMDCREYAMMSSRLNARNAIEDNMKFIRSHVEQEFFGKFFSKPENEGRWTFYFNLPGDEPLSQGVAQAAALSRPERILLQTSNLEVAARTIKQFRNEGYMLRKNIPLYLEPGSGKFEILFLFVPDRVGVLGQNPAQKQRSRTIQRPQERVSGRKTQEIPHFSQKAPTFKQRKG